MVGKKVEGNEDQRRAAAREARREGAEPSAWKETTGASKNRRHLPRSDDHEDKQAAVHQGKQDWTTRAVPDPEVGGGTSQDFRGRGQVEYTETHARVFRALTEAQRARGGEGVYLDDVAVASDLPKEQTRNVLHDLTAVHRLVTETQHADSPDLGPRFEVKSSA